MRRRRVAVADGGNAVGDTAQRKGIWKLNGVREVMTMAMATGSEDDGGGHDSSDDVGQW